MDLVVGAGDDPRHVPDGRAVVEGNAFEIATPINFFNRDRRLERPAPGVVAWTSITTGSFSGFDALLMDGRAGSLRIEMPLGTVVTPVAEIGAEPIVRTFGGLDRKLTIQRLPDANPHTSVYASVDADCDPDTDNPLYVSVVTEDGHQAWSSPIYVVPRPGWL